MADERTLSEIVRRLVDALRPDFIYLFGSTARGEADDDSDLDLMVIVPWSDEPGYRRDIAALRSLRGVASAVDVLVWTRDEFDRRLHLRASLPATVVREGRVLYAA
jgi:predicted nucleotidyltransferase